ncbi:hypothetical protein ACWQEN_000843 [Morganella morganii]
MKKIGDVTSTADKNGEWTNGNVAAGIAPTILEAGWLNSVQREILGVLTKAGIQQDKNNDTQLAEAISKIISGGDYATKTEVNSKLAKDQNGADIPNKPKFIENLGLPETYLALNGGQMSGAINFSANSPGSYDVISLPVGSQKKNKLRTFRGGQSETQWHEAADGDSYTLSTGVNGDAVALSLSHGAGLRTSGRIIPGDYGNFDSRYSPDLSVPVGASIIWNSVSPIPVNFLPHEGRSFSASEYPELAKILPGLKIPDDRGYGIRVADNGRGVDAGRTVGTYQEDAVQNIVGEIPAPIKSSFSTSGTGALKKSKYVNAKGGLNESDGAHINFVFDASDSVRTADETRMKNVAKILIMRVK